VSVRLSSGVAALIAAGVLWGTGGITGRTFGHSGHLPGIAIAAYRLGLGGLLLVIWLLATGQRPPRGPAWRRVCAVAGLAAVFQAAFFSSIAVSSVSLATLVAIGSSPLFVLIYESARQRRWPQRRGVLVVVLAIVGLTLLVGLPAHGSDARRQLEGAGLAAISGAMFAAFTILGRRPLVGITERAVTGYGFLLGGLSLAVLTTAWYGVSGLAIVPTAVAYELFFRGLRSVVASTATVVALLEPLTGTLLATIFLGDRLSPAGIFGAVLLGGAIVASIKTPTAPVGV
jgi:DME family drug/metabolite transporter